MFPAIRLIFYHVIFIGICFLFVPRDHAVADDFGHVKTVSTNSSLFFNDSVTKTVWIKGYAFQLEVAQTDEARARGLMYRKVLAVGHGMLFVFSEEALLPPFWMKNTYIPLDFIWVNEMGIVVFVFKNAQPQSEQLLYCVWPARYVIELPAGSIKHFGIAIGDRVRY